MHFYPNSRPIFIFAEPIKMLVVEDQFGTEVKGRAGPYNEGTDLQLKCRAIGGKCEGKRVVFQNETEREERIPTTRVRICRSEVSVRRKKESYLKLKERANERVHLFRRHRL